jgi:hypothetical protein
MCAALARTGIRRRSDIWKQGWKNDKRIERNMRDRIINPNLLARFFK